jgi:hypothetical protein
MDLVKAAHESSVTSFDVEKQLKTNWIPSLENVTEKERTRPRGETQKEQCGIGRK